MNLTKKHFQKYISRIGGKKNLSFASGFDVTFAKAISMDEPTLETKLNRQREAKEYFHALPEDKRFELCLLMTSFLEVKL